MYYFFLAECCIWSLPALLEAYSILNIFGIYNPDFSTVQLAWEQYYNRTDTTAAD